MSHVFIDAILAFGSLLTLLVVQGFRAADERRPTWLGVARVKTVRHAGLAHASRHSVRRE
jgi:hypothetical protein